MAASAELTPSGRRPAGDALLPGRDRRADGRILADPVTPGQLEDRAGQVVRRRVHRTVRTGGPRLGGIVM